MAFEPNNERLKNTLKNENKEIDKLAKMKAPVSEEQVEKTRPYTFTLQPSIRRKLKRVAKDNKFSSSSKFLNELIKKM